MLAWASSEPQALVCGGAPEGEDKEKIQVAYSLEKAEIFSVCVASDQRRWKNLGCTRPNHLSYNIENKAGPSRSFSSINQWFGVPRQSAVEYLFNSKDIQRSFLFVFEGVILGNHDHGTIMVPSWCNSPPGPLSPHSKKMLNKGRAGR